MPEIVGRSGIVQFMALLTLYAVHRPAVANLHLLAIKTGLLASGFVDKPGMPARSKQRAHKITMRDLDNPRGCAVKQNAINPDSLGVMRRHAGAIWLCPRGLSRDRGFVLTVSG